MSAASNHLEIERKFLVLDAACLDGTESIAMRQGYLLENEDRALRIRQAGERWVLTLKIRKDDVARHEFEFKAPEAEGRAMMALSLSPPVEKLRHYLKLDGHLWEIDVFSGSNAGLVLAEIELKDADAAFPRPDWLGPEVTKDPRFANAALARRPFGDWGINYPELLDSITDQPAQG